jgi:hypothetical protein
MANQALIQGAAAAAPKFNNPMDAFNKSFQEGLSKTVEIKKKEDEAAKKEDEWRADQIANLATVNTEGVPEGLYDSVAGEASALYDKAYDLINKKGDMSASEYAIAMRGITADINQLQQAANFVKELGSDTQEALELGIAPYADEENQNNVLSLTNNKFKKKLVKDKDGKYVVEFEGGKQVSFTSLKPLESPEWDFMTNYETTMEEKLKKLSITSTSLSPERVKAFANSQVNVLSPSKLKSVAMHYELGGKSQAEQAAYFKSASESQVKEELANSIAARMTKMAGDLNKSKVEKPTSRYTKAIEQQIDINEGSAARLFESSEQIAKKGDVEDFLSTLKALKLGTKIYSRNDWFEDQYKTTSDKAAKEKETNKNIKIPTEAEFKKTFDAKYDSSIQIIGEDGKPLKIDVKDPNAVFEQLLKYSGMNKLVATHYDDLYRSKVQVNDVDTGDLPMVQ